MWLTIFLKRSFFYPTIFSTFNPVNVTQQSTYNSTMYKEKTALSTIQSSRMPFCWEYLLTLKHHRWIRNTKGTGINYFFIRNKNKKLSELLFVYASPKKSKVGGHRSLLVTLCRTKSCVFWFSNIIVLIFFLDFVSNNNGTIKIMTCI